MKKEFDAEDYAKNAHVLLKATSTVASNLTFNAARLNEGNEDVHREKLLKSIILLKRWSTGSWPSWRTKRKSSAPRARSRKIRLRRF